MPSPFPGMDPWLEDPEVFPNLHEKMAVYLSDSLNEVLPEGYVATIKNRVWLDEEIWREPDVALFGEGKGPNGSGGIMTLPGLLAIGQDRTSDALEEPYIEILSPRGHRLVTAVEIISVTNKRAGEKGRKAYTDKQHEYRSAGVNLVEIDLLRRGPHVTAVPLARLRKKVAGPFDYHVSVVVAGQPSFFHAAPLKLANRLPEIGVPLAADLPPVKVDLQRLLDRAYDSGRFAALVDYTSRCSPPLTPEQQAWAEGILRQQGVLK